MASRGPTGGIGSNQYTSKPGGLIKPRREHQAVLKSASADVEVDAEMVAVAFSPDGMEPWQQWNATREEILAWHPTCSGTDAAVWLIGRPDITTDQAARFADHFPHFKNWARWSELGIPTAELEQWMTVFPPEQGQGSALREWDVTGRTPEDVQRLIRSPFGSAAEHQFWADRSADPAAAMDQAWAKAHETARAAVAAIHEKGFVREWASTTQARTMGIIDPEHWQTGLAAARAHHADGGQPLTLQTGAKLIAAGVDLDFAVAHLRELTDEAYDEDVAADFVIRCWTDSPHITARERFASIRNDWYDIGSSPVPWMAYGFTPNQATEWIQDPAFNPDDGWYDGPHVGWDTALLAEYRDGGFPTTDRDWVHAIYTADLPTTDFALRAARFIRDRGGSPGDFTRFCQQTGL